MKLSDIDTIMQAKSAYHSCRDQLTAVRKNAPYELVFHNSGGVKNRAVLGRCKEIAVEILTEELEELKTKLVLYGVTDFEGFE